MKYIWRACWFVTSVGLLSCQSNQAEEIKALTFESRVPKAVVATVNGQPISLSAVEEQLKKTPERSRDDVLDDFIFSELAFREAATQFSKDPAMLLAQKRFMVQQMLKERIEDKFSAEAMEPEELEKFYLFHEGRYYRPRIRVVDNLLVYYKDQNLFADPSLLSPELRDAALKMSEKLRAEIVSLPIEALTDERIQALIDGHKKDLPEGLQLKFEKRLKVPIRSVGASKEKATLRGTVEPFREATFRMTAGTLSRPVQTNFGAHLILFKAQSDDLPEEVIKPKDEALDELRDELVVLRRRQESQKLFKSISDKAKIKSNESLVKKLTTEKSEVKEEAK